MLLHNSPPHLGGQDTPTASLYAGAFTASPSDRLSPFSSPLTLPHPDQLPFFPNLPTSPPSLPPLPNDHLYEEADSIPSPTDIDPLSPASASPFEDELPPPLPPLPSSPPPLPLLSSLPNPHPSSPHPLRLSLPPTWPSLFPSLLTTRHLCSASISHAQSIHLTASRLQVRATHTHLLKANQEVAALRAKVAQARLRLQDKTTQTKSVLSLKTQLDQVDGSLLALLRRRRQAITKEHVALFARVDSLLGSAGKLDRLMEPMTAALQRSLQAIREGVVVSREADAVRRQEEERELREAYDGHLPKLVTTDSDQVQHPAWGEEEGWDKPEQCIRYSMTLVDEGRTGKGHELVGPFHLVEAPEQRTVRLRTDPFGEGAMRLAYLCEDITDCPPGDLSNAIHLVAKESRWRRDYKGVLENRREFYTGDISAQLMGQLLVERFNALNPPKLVQMLTPMLYEFPDRPDADRRYMLMELCLIEHGEFQRYTDNESWRNPAFESMMALSHWSHASTGGKWLLCDLQGVGYLLTDPQIHSLDDKWGQGDIGVAGMSNFYSSHFCNDLCRKLQLKPHPAQPKEKPEDFSEGETRAKEQYASKVIGVCGHVFELGIKERKAWLKSGQRMPCPACKKVNVDEHKSFFGFTLGRS